MAGIGYRFSRSFSLETTLASVPVAGTGGGGRAAVIQLTASIH